MSLDYLIKTGSTTFNSQGLGTVTLRPDVGQIWAPSFVRVSTASRTQVISGFNTGLAKTPYCAVYQGPVTNLSATTFIDDTYQGNGDTSSVISGTITQFGEAVTAQFSGGTSGDTGVFTLYGRSSTDLPTLANQLSPIPGTRFAGGGILTPILINDVGTFNSTTVFYPTKYIGDANYLMVDFQSDHSAEVQLTFYADAAANSAIDTYYIDTLATLVARQPIPVLGPFVNITVFFAGVVPVFYNLEVYKMPIYGTFSGQGVEAAVFSKFFTAIGANTAIQLTSIAVLEGEVHWSGNVNVANYFIQLIATDFNGNQTILDQIDQGNVANALSSRTIYVPPMAIQAKIMNQTAGAGQYNLYATRKRNH